MNERVRGKILHDWQDKGIVLILGDDKKTYMGHWDFVKKGKAKRSKKVYFYVGEPEVLSDGTVAKSPTALDIVRFAELPEDEQKVWSAKNAKTAKVEAQHEIYETDNSHFAYEIWGTCSNCGDTVKQGDRYCHYCGMKLEWK